MLKTKGGICKSNFTHEQDLNGHIASVHEGKKQFKCDTCDAKFTQKQSVKKHIATIHERKHI